MDFCFSENKKVGLMTNGLLVDDQIAQKIVDGCYEFCVSINAATKTTHEIVNVGSKWERVLDNIAKIKIRKHQSGSELEIRGHFTIVNSNIHEIPLFIKTFEFLGFEKIDFGFDGTVARLLHRFPNVKSQLTRSITKNIVGHPNSQLIDTKRLRILGLLSPSKLGASCDQ